MKKISRRAVLVSLGAAAGGSIFPGILHAAMSKKSLPDMDLSFLPAGIMLRKRSDWTDQVPKPWILKPAGLYDRITVHHSGSMASRVDNRADSAKSIEAIRQDHLTRDYGDIAYHFVVDYSGVVWVGRSLSYEGAHVSGQNERNLGIVLLGNFEEQKPSRDQSCTLVEIIESLRDRFQIKRHRIYGHRDLGKSVCPGNNLYSYVEKIRKP